MSNPLHWTYRVEFVSVLDDGTKRVWASYVLPENVGAQFATHDLSDEALVAELKRRWSNAS